MFHSFPRLLFLLLGATHLVAGLAGEATLGISMQRRENIPFGPARIGGSNQTALIFRGAWDQESSLSAQGVIRGQWTAAFSSARSIECDEQALAVGFQRVFWSQENHRTQAGIGAEIRGSRRAGKDFDAYCQVPGTNPWDPPGSYYGASVPVRLGGRTAWEARPVLRAFLGFRGLLVPLFPYFPIWKGPPGEIHSITRLEVAVPLWRQGGEGNLGLLRKLAPGLEFTYSVGVRFNPAI